MTFLNTPVTARQTDMIYVVTHARQGVQVFVNLIRRLYFPILFGSNQCVKQPFIAFLTIG